jgi:hypothetical protein
MLATVVMKDPVDEVPEVSEGVDEGQEQWDRLQRRLTPHAQIRKFHIAALCQAYEEMTGTLTGCD